jgi:hypothetical protein
MPTRDGGRCGRPVVFTPETMFSAEPAMCERCKPCPHGVTRWWYACRRCDLDEQRRPSRELAGDHRQYEQPELFATPLAGGKA